jgi:Fe-S oxidoreductase
MISTGLLEDAKVYARRNVDLLYPYAQAGIKVVGIEPSCLLTLRDDYLDLLPDDDKAKVVAEETLLLEEFLSELRDSGEIENKFNRLDQNFLFFPHCHQKALLGSEPSLNILRLITGQPIRELDSGCCGMAGSFGHESEHYDLSMSIGGSRLFPAIETAEDYEIVTNGFSCQQQIEDGTGRRPYHIAEVLAEALGIIENLHEKPSQRESS